MLPKSAVTATTVRGVTKHQLTSIEDVRGNLVAGEFLRQVPFQPKRYFTAFEVPGPEVRGQHAHHRCEQFLVCISGSVSVIVDDGASRETIDLCRPDEGLFVPAMIWAVQL